jgi:homocysteine S-methyltransferase
LDHAFAKLLQSDAEILGINCVNGPQEALRLVEQLVTPEAPLAAFPNAGLPRYEEGRYLYEVSPESFAEIGVLMIARGVRIIGGCCGTNPSHIAALAARLSGTKNAF